MTADPSKPSRETGGSVSEVELRECPFCGGRGALRFAGLNLNSGGGYRHVYCDPENGGCGCQMRSVAYTSHRAPKGARVSEHDAELEAARLWNARKDQADE